MLTFLFWNLRGNQEATWPARAPGLLRHLGRLVAAHSVDVLLLAESRFDTAALAASLNDGATGPFYCPTTAATFVQLYSRLPHGVVVDQFNDASERLNIRRVVVPGKPPFLLANLHYHSRTAWTREDQLAAMPATARLLNEVEDLAACRRTVLVGDLNMDPFDPGVASAFCLHARMTLDLARREGRMVASQSFRTFYNPMWAHFGDRTPGPPGTHFYPSSGKPMAQGWHVFDQVLLRPEIANCLTELRILDSDGVERLVTDRGRPRELVSDHLPLLFSLDI